LIGSTPNWGVMREKAIPVSEPSFPGRMIEASAAGGEVPILSDGCQRGLASRSKSLAPMNKSRYRRGVEATKDESELRCGEPMTSANSLLPILRRLDEIERKLDRVLQELETLNTPVAIGYSVRRGNLPRKE